MKPKHPLTILLAVLVVLLCADAATFGQSTTLQQRLAGTKRLRCTFSVMVTGTWKDGTPAGEVKPAKIEVAFSNLSVEDGTAEADGAFGTSFISVRYSNDYLHLMQMQSSGPLYTTTVLARETKEGRLMAVHTRHEYTDVRLPTFTSRPEMYLGECTVGT